MGLIRKVLDESRLDQAHYVRSLLEELLRTGMIAESSAQNIQMNFLVFLRKRVQRFTFDESSSVRVETAEQLLESILYTVGAELKSHLDFCEQIYILLNTVPEDLYREGQEKISCMFDTAKLYYKKVLETALSLHIHAYHDTIEKGIPAFFKQYDKDFSAHETVIFHDYPLAFDKMDYVGVEYILLYLKKLLLENRFCCCFSNDTIIKLLKNYDSRYEDLLLNVFQVVLRNYIGCMLAARDKCTLSLTNEDCLQIEKRLLAFTDTDYQNMSAHINAEIIEQIKIADSFEVQYITCVVKEILFLLKNAVKEGKTASFFVLTIQEIPNERIELIEGKQLDDSVFRKITEEMRSCRHLSDKITILKQKIHSITDMADLLDADCFYGDEYTAYYQTLSSLELALLITHTILFDLPPQDSLLEQVRSVMLTKEWQIQLCKYLDCMDEQKVLEITDYRKKIRM